MKRFLALAALAMVGVPALAEPVINSWKTAHSQGCMLTRECTTGVTILPDVSVLEEIITTSDYSIVREEADKLIKLLKDIGVDVYVADDKYFMSRTAGVYYTVGNDLFLNLSYVDDPVQLIQTLRHEGWHAAQDAMAGTILNNQIAIIYPEEAVPQGYVVAATLAYGENNPALPWEKEAKWAGYTENMTVEVLESIVRTDGKPWEEIDPTPLTRLWLERNGYL